jgi:hypothetical protein
MFFAATNYGQNIFCNTIPNSGILLNTVSTIEVDPTTGGSSSNSLGRNDDEAFAGFVELIVRTAEEIIGTPYPAWSKEHWLGVLSTEFKIAAGRTTVSRTPTFLAEYLRRRL